MSKVSCLILALFNLLSFATFSQKLSDDELEVLYLIYQLPDLDMLKTNSDGNTLYVMYNNVVEDSVYNPIDDQFNELNIFILPRSYIVGHYIQEWLVIDSLANTGDSWFIQFRAVTSLDNWLPSNDKTCVIGEVRLGKTGAGQMKILDKKIDRR